MVRFVMLAAAVIVFGATIARGQDTEEVKRLKARIEALEKENANLYREIESLKQPKADSLAVGTKWKGKLTVNKNQMGTTVTVVERGEKSAKLSVSYENGAVWVFECVADGAVIRIKDVERDRAADVNVGKAGLRPLGGTTGTVEVTAEKITMNYTVKANGKEPALVSRVVAERQK